MKQLLLLFAIAFSATAWSQTSSFVNYQGALRDDSGKPLSDQNIKVRFRLLNASTEVFSQEHSSVTLKNGLFNALIGGSGQLDTLRFGAAAYDLEVSVDVAGAGYKTFATQRIGSVPFALRSGDVESHYASGVLRIGTRTYTLSTPETYQAGNGIAISSGTISNTAPDVTVTVVNGNANVSVTGTYPNFTVSSNPTLNYANDQLGISEGNTVTIAPTLSITGNTLTIGPSSNSITLPAAGSPSIHGSGIASVTPLTGGEFTVAVPSPSYSNNGPVTITGTYPNLTVNSPTIPPAASVTAVGIATVSPGPSFTLGVPAPTFTSSGTTSITGTYPNFTVVSPAIPAATTMSAAGIATVSPGPNFTVGVPAPTFTSSGTTSITGTYPHFTVVSPAIPAPTTMSATGIATVSTGPNFTVGVQSPSFTSTGPTSITGTYPNLTVVSPTIPAATTMSAAGIATVSAGPNFTVGVQTPNFTSTGPTSITGTYPNLTVVSPTIPAATTMSAAGIATVSAGPNFTVGVQTPNFTSTGPTSITGTYPNLTVVSPTIPAATTMSAAGIATVSAGPNFTVGVQTPNFTSTGPTSITGTYPNLTVVSPTIPAATTMSAAGIATVSAGPNFTVGVQSPNFTSTGPTSITGTYPNLTVVSPTIPPAATVSAVGIATVSAGPNFTVGVQTPVFTNSGVTQMLGAYPNYTVFTPVPPTPTVTGAGLAAVTPSTGMNFTVTVPTLTYNPGSGVMSSGTNTVLVAPLVTYTNDILHVGPTSNSVALTASPWTGTTSAVFLNNPAAKVGIGTSSPGHDLHIEKPGSVQAGLVANSTGIAALSFGTPTNNFLGNIRYDNSINEMNFWTNNTPNRLVIDNAGRVGIGIATPTTMLQVGSYSTTSDNHISIKTSSGNLYKAGIHMNHFNDVDGFTIESNETVNRLDIIRHSNTSHTVMSFSRTDDFIGIGTTAPTASLHLAGTFRLVDGTEAANRVLTSDASGNASWQPAPIGWAMSGNAGTIPTVNFIGTVDNVPLNFRVNNQKSGTIDHLTKNTFIGYQTGNSITTGSLNTAFGEIALRLNTTGHQNTAIGRGALKDNTGGGNNTAVGSEAMFLNTTGNLNTAFGYESLYNNTTGSENTGVGPVSLNMNTIGNENVAIGNDAMITNVAGSRGTAIGHSAMRNANNTATPFNNQNVAIGFEALRGSATPASNTGNGNLAVGYQALRNNTTGSDNVAIGNGAGNSVTTGNGNVFIGSNAGFSETGSNKLYIANSNTTTPLLYGDFATGNVGINTNAPSAKLHVNGTLRFTDGAEGTGKVLTSDAGGNASWQPVAGGWSLGGNSGTSPATNFVGTTDAQALAFRTGNNERMRFTATGELGIGTAAPTNAVHITSASTATATLRVDNTGGGGFSAHFTNGVGIGPGTGSPGGNLAIAGRAGIGAAYYNAPPPANGLIVEGNTGIGTSAPGGRLDVNADYGRFTVTNFAPGSGGTANTVLLATMIGTPSVGPQMRFEMDGSPTFMDIGQNANEDFVIEGNDTPRLVVQNSGNVGIGTVLPSAKLHVVTGASSNIFLENSGGSILKLAGEGSASSMGTSNNFPLDILTNNFSRIRVDNIGRVGVNTAAPTATFHVVGSVRIENGSQANGRVLTSDANGNATWAAPASASRMRSVIVDPNMIDISGAVALLPPTKNSIGGWARPCINYPDGSTTQIQLNLPIPADWNTTSNFTLTLLYSSPSTAGNFEMSISNSNVGLGTTAASPTSGSNFNLPAHATVADGVMQFQHVMFTSSTDKMIQIYIRRNGGSGGDTSNQPMRLFGVRLDYMD